MDPFIVGTLIGAGSVTAGYLAALWLNVRMLKNLMELQRQNFEALIEQINDSA